MANTELMRALVAAVLIPAALGCVVAGGVPLLALVVAFAVPALAEYSRMAFGSTWSGMASKLTMLGGAAYLTASFVGRSDLLAPITLGIVVLAGFAEVARGRVAGAASRLAMVVFGAVYIGLGLAYLLLLRAQVHVGVWGVIFAMMVTWMTDTAAYFVGRAFGRHKLSPVSPKKSWEGAAGGLVASCLMSLAFAKVLGLSMPEAALVAGIVSVAGQVGDLVESLIKRDTGVKDSGAALPGHGGILDRIDSLLFTGPAAYYLLLYLSRK